MKEKYLSAILVSMADVNKFPLLLRWDKNDRGIIYFLRQEYYYHPGNDFRQGCKNSACTFFTFSLIISDIDMFLLIEGRYTR